MSQTTKYYYPDIQTMDVTHPVVQPRITIYNADCFQVANAMDAKKVVIHNFANNRSPGGPCSQFTVEGNFISNPSWANTQEDQIVKRYTKNLILPRDMYPICPLVVNDDTVGFEALLYTDCVDAGLADIITLPAIQDPNYMKRAQWKTMVNRIKLMLAVCGMRGKKLITGLWGCGAFGGKPSDLLELWKEALADASIPKPDEIIFAIRIDGASSKWGSYQDMEKLFNQLS